MGVIRCVPAGVIDGALSQEGRWARGNAALKMKKRFGLNATCIELLLAFVVINRMELKFECVV